MSNLPHLAKERKAVDHLNGKRMQEINCSCSTKVEENTLEDICTRIPYVPRSGKASGDGLPVGK